MRCLFFILFFLIIPAVSGYTGIFSILDEKYIDQISDLPYSAGTPDMNIQRSWGTQAWIEGWIDITGFRNMTQENGTYYVNGNPAIMAIIQNDAYGKFKCSICDYSIKKTLSVWDSGNYTIANLDVKMTWYELVCTKDGCSCVQHIEYAVFQDSEKSPYIYPSLQTGIANITEYNNTIYPKTAISLNLPGNISKATYRYGNDTLAHYFRQGHVEQTAKGIYFLNLSERDFWTSDTESLQHLNTWVMIPNTSRPDYSNLTIEISNSYETGQINNYSVERITYNSGSTFSNPLLMFVGTVTIFIFIAIIVIRRT